MQNQQKYDACWTNIRALHALMGQSDATGEAVGAEDELVATTSASPVRLDDLGPEELEEKYLELERYLEMKYVIEQEAKAAMEAKIREEEEAEVKARIESKKEEILRNMTLQANEVNVAAAQQAPSPASATAAVASLVAGTSNAADVVESDASAVTSNAQLETTATPASPPASTTEQAAATPTPAAAATAAAGSVDGSAEVIALTRAAASKLCDGDAQFDRT